MWGRGEGSHGNPRRWLWVGERQRSSWQSQNLVVGGGERKGLSWQSQLPVCKGLGLTLMAIPDASYGGGEAGVHMAVQTLFVVGRGGG